MPTFTVFTGVGTYDPASNQFELENTTEYDCDTYKCMFDPDGDGCR